MKTTRGNAAPAALDSAPLAPHIHSSPVPPLPTPFFACVFASFSITHFGTRFFQPPGPFRHHWPRFYAVCRRIGIVNVCCSSITLLGVLCVNNRCCNIKVKSPFRCWCFSFYYLVIRRNIWENHPNLVFLILLVYVEIFGKTVQIWSVKKQLSLKKI